MQNTRQWHRDLDKQSRLLSLVEEKGHYILALVICLVCSATALSLYFHDRQSFLYFGDSVSHIVKARQFFDSQRTGIQNIGTVWLPLFHLVLIPFVAIDSLFYSGIAGPIIGISSLAGTAAILFLSVRRISGSAGIAFLSGCLFGLNPNMVYMSLTPMSESLFLLLVSLGGYSLLRWQLGDGIHWLWYCTIAIAMASVCRYEAWVLVPFVTIMIYLPRLFRVRAGDTSSRVVQFLAAGTSWAGIAFWFLWNYAVYNDPFKFAHWTYSVAADALPMNVRQTSPTSLVIASEALLVIFGPGLLLAASLVFFRQNQTPQDRPHVRSMLVYLGLPAFFALAAILAGFVQMDRWGSNWRYALAAGPLLAVAAGIGVSELFRKVHTLPVRAAVILCLAAMPIFQITFSNPGVATFTDARRSLSDNTRFAVALGDQLHSLYTDGSILLLTGYGQAQRIMISSGLPLRTFHIVYDPADEDILGSPAHSEKFLVIGKDRTPESERIVNDWLLRREEFLQYYSITFESLHYLLLERKADVVPGD